MKNVNLQIEVEIHPQVVWRLKLFMAIMRFAVWVGGFGGVEFEIPTKTPPNNRLHMDAGDSPRQPSQSTLEGFTPAEQGHNPAPRQ